MFKKLIQNKRGINLAVIGMIMMAIVGFICIAVMLPVGLLTTQTLKTTLGGIARGTNMGTAGKIENTTAEAIFTNTWAAFSLLSISPIVMGAAVLMSIMMVAFIGILVGRRQ